MAEAPRLEIGVRIGRPALLIARLSTFGPGLFMKPECANISESEIIV